MPHVLPFPGRWRTSLPLFQNQAILLESLSGTASGENSGIAAINAAGGDSLTLSNVSGSTVTLNNKAGGPQKSVSASIFLLKVGPTVKPDPVLADVNAAQDKIQMDAAIRASALGLDLTVYDDLDEWAQSHVLFGLLVNKPDLGYLTTDYLQQLLNYQVVLAQKTVNPNSVYVQAGATGGDGSMAAPFGTIPDGIAAVCPGGNVFIMSGDYPITSQITVNKNGISLSGKPGNKLLMKAQITPMLITGRDVTVENLNFTSDIAYLGVFIEAAANGAVLRNNDIYGPPNPNVVNRGILLDDNRTGIIVDSNYIHSLVQGIAVASGVQGTINNNHIEETQTGIIVYSGSMIFVGNYWSGTKNTYDIGLMRSIAGNYQVDQLSANNNNAKVQIF